MLMDPAIFGVRSRLPFPPCNPRDTPSHQPVPCGSRTERVEWRLGGCFWVARVARGTAPATARLRLRGSCRPRGTERRVWRQGTVCLARCIRDRGLDPGAKNVQENPRVWRGKGEGGRGEQEQQRESAEEKAITMSGPRARLRKFIMAVLPQHLAVLWPFQVELLRSDDGGFPGVADVATTCSIEQLR
jgi:hypothetical protein